MESHPCFDAFWVIVSFRETRGQQGWYVRTANTDVYKGEENPVCWELLSLCGTAKLETLGGLQAKCPSLLKEGRLKQGRSYVQFSFSSSVCPFCCKEGSTGTLTRQVSRCWFACGEQTGVNSMLRSVYYTGFVSLSV